MGGEAVWPLWRPPRRRQVEARRMHRRTLQADVTHARTLQADVTHRRRRMHARRHRRAPHCTGGRCLLRLMTLMTNRGMPLGMLL